MKKLLKRVVPFLLCIAIVFSVVPAEAKYTPPTTTVKIGLDYGSGALKASYLEAEDGYGDGFRFGYYNDREFVPIGKTSYTDVAVLRDTNMYKSGSTYSTTPGSGITVGCYHIQIDKEYPSYSAAKTAADTFTSVDAFVKFDNGKYYVCAGDYTTSSAASSVASNLDIASDYFITSGSQYTVVLIRTSTGEILFEFEWGTTYYLGVEPYCNDGTNPRTWHAGYLYHGGFRFGRQTGGDVFCINVVDIEDYLKGVVPYEMSASWPREALKAQAVCARSFVMAKLNYHKSNDFDVCDTSECQVYSGLGRATDNSNAAVRETAGVYMLYDGKLCTAYYCSSNGGATENVTNVWNTSPIGYLQGVVDPYEADIADSVSNYNWSYTFTGAELASELRAAGYSCSTIKRFYVSEYTPTGNVYSLTFVDTQGKSITIIRRNCVTVLGLRSQRFKVYNKASNGELIDTSPAVKALCVNDGETISGSLGQYYGIGGSGTISQFGSDTLYAITSNGTTETVGDEVVDMPDPVSNTFVISGTGWGHNVGMSQWGAYSMAKYHDKTYDEILKFYFTGVTVE